MINFPKPSIQTNKSRIHLVCPDSHAHPDYHNKRADWLGKLILDVKPDVVINIGDMWDFPSMCIYDKGKASSFGREYKRDLDSGLEFDDRVWHKVRKAKKKLPYSIFCEGNHEHRMTKLLDTNPELTGLIGFDDLDLERNYNEVIRYEGNTPGYIGIDGVHYGHYFISGVMGRPISGEHPAYSLITKLGSSATCGHIHTTDYCVRNDINGNRRMGLISGVYQDYTSTWAGKANNLWWRGVIVKRNVQDGCYEPQWISIEALKKEYG